jgi:hypothetical protein
MEKTWAKTGPTRQLHVDGTVTHGGCAAFGGGKALGSV